MSGNRGERIKHMNKASQFSGQLLLVALENSKIRLGKITRGVD